MNYVYVCSTCKYILGPYDLESGMSFWDKKSKISIVYFISHDFQQSFLKGD